MPIFHVEMSSFLVGVFTGLFDVEFFIVVKEDGLIFILNLAVRQLFLLLVTS
ncbi:hypothetical protein GCM10007941_26100 [Amphritea balenae]|nr:hypothetical protein GCM10007941_26100 [Amphritea balenae]